MCLQKVVVERAALQRWPLVTVASHVRSLEGVVPALISQALLVGVALAGADCEIAKLRERGHRLVERLEDTVLSPRAL